MIRFSRSRLRTRPALDEALIQLLEAERRSKTTGAPAEALAYEALYHLAQRGNKS